MSCRSSFSFMITASGAGSACARTLARPLLPGKQYRDDRRDRAGWLVRRDHGNHPLIRLGRLQGVELGAEQLLREEMTVPGGQPPGEHLAIHGQEDHPGFGTAAE